MQGDGEWWCRLTQDVASEPGVFKCLMLTERATYTFREQRQLSGGEGGW